MDKSLNKYIYYLLVSVVVLGCSCRKENWDKHTTLVDQDLSKDLLQVISEDPQLSEYASYLVKTGYDKVLSKSQSHTVWAPSNDALAKMDPQLLSNEQSLKLFIGNTIANQAYFTDMPKDSLIIPVLSGKRILFTSTAFEEGKIIRADQYVANGVLHVVNEISAPKPNAWEFLQSYVDARRQFEFIEGQDHPEIDASNGVLLYIDPVTQMPVYQDGTTKDVIRNYYFQNVYDISSEDSLCTYIILTDAAFEYERNKLSPYYSLDSIALKSDSLTKWSVVKDLVIRGVYSKDMLADSLISVNGVQLHIDKSNIIETKALSNGIAYVVNKIDYKVLTNKIPTIVVQGETPDSLSTTSVNIRTKRNPDGVSTYTDIQVGSLTKAGYYFRYSADLNTVKYKVYWRAVNDIYTTPFKMQVSLSPWLTYYSSSSILTQNLGFTDVMPHDFNEVYLGEYTPDNYGHLNIFLVSSESASSAVPAALTLDYLKFVPVN